MKLFKIELQDYKLGTFFVVANDPTEAYNKVRQPLDKGDLGFRNGRELRIVEVIADDYHYSDIPKLIV